METSGNVQGYCDNCKVQGDYNEVKKHRWIEDQTFGFCSRSCTLEFAEREIANRKMISEWVNAE
jgi:hypothetical protein